MLETTSLAGLGIGQYAPETLGEVDIQPPFNICAPSFQQAWVSALRHLINNRSECWNLSVHISEPSRFDKATHGGVVAFAAANRLLNPRDVAYTIFPHGLYERARSAAGVFSRYERFHERIRRRPHYRWGTYFRRMTHYETTGGPVNQLDRIISAVNSRGKTHRAAYTILIQYPCVDTTRPLGAPCLNFIAVQMEGRDPRRLGLLCVYRNHDFANRAYGNYWGLCDLLVFLARETQSQPGPLTCLSSHAYLGMSVARALQLLGRMP